MHESVLVAVFDSKVEKLLLTKRRDIPVWVFPGGRIEKDETPEMAAIRESLEETGFEIEIIKKVGEYTPRNRLSHFTHFFKARIVSGNAKTGDETKALQFFDPHALPYPLPPPYRLMTKHALDSNSLIRMPLPQSSYFHFLTALIRRPDLVFRFVLMKLGVHLNG